MKEFSQDSKFTIEDFVNYLFTFANLNQKFCARWKINQIYQLLNIKNPVETIKNNIFQHNILLTPPPKINDRQIFEKLNVKRATNEK